MYIVQNGEIIMSYKNSAKREAEEKKNKRRIESIITSD
jgi:hypothetical protein